MAGGRLRGQVVVCFNRWHAEITAERSFYEKKRTRWPQFSAQRVTAGRRTGAVSRLPERVPSITKYLLYGTEEA